MKHITSDIIIIFMLLICIVLIYSLGTPSNKSDQWVKDREGKALDACITQTGVPILDAQGTLTTCQWPFK